MFSGKGEQAEIDGKPTGNLSRMNRMIKDMHKYENSQIHKWLYLNQKQIYHQRDRQGANEQWICDASIPLQLRIPSGERLNWTAFPSLSRLRFWRKRNLAKSLDNGGKVPRVVKDSCLSAELPNKFMTIFWKCIPPKYFFPKCIFPTCIYPKCIFAKFLVRLLNIKKLRFPKDRSKFLPSLLLVTTGQASELIRSNLANSTEEPSPERKRAFKYPRGQANACKRRYLTHIFIDWWSVQLGSKQKDQSKIQVPQVSALKILLH